MHSSIFRTNVHFARHVETTKNLLGIHGETKECGPTQNTDCQLLELIDYIKKYKIKKIVTGRTQQCKYTTGLLLKKLCIDECELELFPLSMAEYSGMTQAELRANNLSISIAMEQFRYRVLPYKKTSLTKIADPQQIADEIIHWSQNISDDCLSDVIYILSSSLIVKLVNFAQGILPTSNEYFNIGVDTGGVINLDQRVIQRNQWPLVQHKSLHTNRGNVVLAEFTPKISMHEDLTAIVYPGIFGASRFGPYNLFNRLAHKLADSGIRCVVFDPIGSGESTQIHRTIETERASLNAVVHHYGKDKPLAICAHSLSANILNKLIDAHKVHKSLIAPLLDLSSLKQEWGVQNNNISRHGLDFSSDLWDDSNLTVLLPDENTDYYFGACDGYVDFRKLNNTLSKDRVHVIEGAGHNFSEGNSSIDLIGKIVQAMQEFSWRCKSIAYEYERD